MVAHGVEDLLLGYRIGHGVQKRDRAGHSCYCEDEVSSVCCEKELYLRSCICNLVASSRRCFLRK